MRSHVTDAGDAAPAPCPELWSGLPPDLTSFEGRRGELADIKRLLGEGRLVTLTGFGGVGKTRLALRAARELGRAYPDGVAWVELADLRDPTLLTQAIVDALHLDDRPGRDTWSAVMQHLRDRRVLLVLDNCEHLLAGVADCVDRLLRNAPETRVLATSRHVLDIPGERRLPVDPLPVPPVEEDDSGTGTLYPALSLFHERAAAAVPGFAITPDNRAAAVELCRKLDGIPLAIELAAVKLRVLDLEDLVDRLDARLELLRHPGRSCAPRHRTIEATIDWSYDLCSPDERLLWARASVFAGGFSIGAAEEVCADDRLPVESVIDVVQGLVEKSVLVRFEAHDRVRFRLLAPMREHGLRRLHDDGDDREVAHRHLAWCEELLRQASLQWFGPAQERWCTTLRLEHPNLRAAAEHCLQHVACRDRALAVLGRPWFLWIALFLDEGRQWLERVVESCTAPSRDRVRSLGTLAYVAALQGDQDRALEAAAEGRRLAASLEDHMGLAYTAHMSGLSALFTEPARSVELLLEALPLYESEDAYDDYIVGLRIQLGLAHLFNGQLSHAGAQFERCRELCSVTGERWLLSYALYGLGFASRLEGDPEAGLGLAREALEIKWFFRDLCGLATTMDLIAWLHADLGRNVEGAMLLGAAASLWESFGVRLFGSDDWMEQMTQAEEVFRGHLGQRGFQDAFRRGSDLDRADAITLALGKEDSEAPAPRSKAVHLTPREEEVSALVADGKSNKVIAEHLVIAQRTAEGHVENILAKLGFRSRSQIATWVTERRTAGDS